MAQVVCAGGVTSECEEGGFDLGYRPCVVEDDIKYSLLEKVTFGQISVSEFWGYPDKVALAPSELLEM